MFHFTSSLQSISKWLRSNNAYSGPSLLGWLKVIWSLLEVCPNKLPLSKAIVSHKLISQHILPQRDPWPCDTPLNNIGLPPRNRIESLLHTWFRVCKTTLCVFISANYVVECTPAILSTSRNQFMVMVLLYWPKTLIEVTVIAPQCENHTFRATCGLKI